MSVIKQDFKTLKAKYKKLNAIPYVNGEENEDYWKARKRFTLFLKQFLDSDTKLELLTTRQLLYFIGLCNTYKPLEPWQMMRDFAMINDRIIGE